MKNRFIFLIIMFAANSPLASAGSGSENSLLFEFKNLLTCEAAKKELSNHKVEVDCDRSDRQKKRYFGGHYFGKKSVNAIIAEFKKHAQLVSVTANVVPKRIQ